MEPHIHLCAPPSRKSTPSAVTSSGTAPTDWYASTTTSAPTSCARRTTGATSTSAPVAKLACETLTSSVRSSIAAHRRSSSIRPPSEGTTTASAP